MQDFASLDTLLTVLIVATLPVCLLRPWVGMGLRVDRYMNPHAWSAASRINALCKDGRRHHPGGLLVTRERYALPRTREVYLLAALWGRRMLHRLHCPTAPVAWRSSRRSRRSS